MKNNEAKVPTSRLSRLSKMGGLASRLAGNVLLEGAKQLSQGKSPSMQQLMMTPKNIGHVADKLSQLRGAAMKVGQMLSMDAGDLVPPELAEILAKLRSDAKAMPHKQLTQLLVQHWGRDWLAPFAQFELRPFAAASIGQVHLAYLDTGEKLAIKIQYPGIRDSIDSDIDNVASLLKVSRLIPANVKLDTLLAEAKAQLHNEADYQFEAQQIALYQQQLGDNPHFIVPKVYPQLSNNSILCMQYVEGSAIESVAQYPQDIRDKVASALMELCFKELFCFQLVQSDPNFANFQYQADSQKIVLLDFGATRTISDTLSQGYMQLMQGAIADDKQQMSNAAQQIGFFQNAIDPQQKQLIIDIFYQACEPLRSRAAYDFGASDLAKRITQAGKAMSTQQNEWHTPPTDAIFIHRKLAGMYLLAAKLNANINVHALFNQVVNSKKE
ncbi:AarF/ABC1/UbiB kinase family protein [Shewanella frigidimarina]|uniref:ABC1 kinase family protein n=1 Tax=Shewanella frigidimarina TaxID=56812 RepID=UPI000F4EA582|nr:AarF/ABC1/UbiB kinase family protein [Shewanella frigidimarina]RPA63122.1 AarF/ABC1/UbiB kinase family protein [Shewanella frigidimarina]